MTATARLQQSLQGNLQSSLQDQNVLADHTQYLSAVFCRALYDYQSRDASSLSFRKGDIIEVLTQLDSGWWDGLLHDERGWFPSNYVAPVSEQEMEQELRAARLDSQDLDWHQDLPSEQTGPPNDFWVPQVAIDGRVSLLGTQLHSMLRIIFRYSMSILRPENALMTFPPKLNPISNRS